MVSVQDPQNNTSTIYWYMYYLESDSTTADIQIFIDGKAIYQVKKQPVWYWQDGASYFANGVTSVSHDSDGTKSINVAIKSLIYKSGVANQCSGNDDWELPTIARAGTILSAINITLGEESKVTWKPTNKSFSYTLNYKIGDWSYNAPTVKPEDIPGYYDGASILKSYVLPTKEVAEQITRSAVGTVTVTMSTFNGAYNLGTSSKTFTVTIPDSVKPTINNFSVSPVYVGESAPSDSELYVVGSTKAKLIANASGVYGSTISSYEVSGPYTTSVTDTTLNYTGDVLSTSGEISFSVVAIDTRGKKSNAVTRTINVLKYNPPSITRFTVARSDTEHNKVIVYAEWNVDTTSGSNPVTIVLNYKQMDSSVWTTYGGTITNGRNVTLNVSFDEAHSYNFSLTITDKTGGSVSKSAFLSTASVLLDFRAGGGGLGIGKISEKNAMEVNMDAHFLKKIYVYVDGTPIALSQYIKDVISGKIQE